MPKKQSEEDLYEGVERWLKRHFACFKTGQNKGLRHGRIDVIGVRDIGGDFSGAIEIIGVEVKRGSFPFANACGQTLGYNVYANRVYLADVRNSGFSRDEIDIASHLGIGLIEIKKGKCFEVRSSPFYTPIEKLSLGLLARLALGRCQLCQSFFETGTADANRFGNVTREFKRALKGKENKGIIFWNWEISERKTRLKLDARSGHFTYERRFLCPDCVQELLGQFALKRAVAAS